MTLKEITKLIKDFEGSELTELELEFDEVKLRLSKNVVSEFSNHKLNNNIEAENITIIDPSINLPETMIKSPLVGTFYESSSPGSNPFIEVGQAVKVGDVVCIIEAMKIMNEITSNVNGIVEKVFFKNGDVVGFDEPLFTVKINASNN